MVEIHNPFIHNKLPFISRLILWASGAIAGLVLQINSQHSGPIKLRFLGFLIVGLASIIPLMTRVWTNKPNDQGEEDWVAASTKELDRLMDNFNQTKKLKPKSWYRKEWGRMITGVALIIGAIMWFSSQTIPFALNFLVLFFPVLNFLTISLWEATELRMILFSLHYFLEKEKPEDVKVTPYLRLDRDEKGLRVPESARLLIEPRRKPNDLVGIQVQVAINDGPNGKVPYAYAVVLCRGKEASFKHVSTLRFNNFKIEMSSKKEGGVVWGTVVFRQNTKGGGYHTKRVDCMRLADLSYKVLASVSEAVKA